MMRVRTLVYGIGNPGRRDDGLGPRFIELLEAEDLGGVDCESNYQLNVEDALACSKYDIVIFADAATIGSGPFEFRKLKPARKIAVTSHEMAPESVLALAEELYHRRPKAWLLAIRGHDWNIGEGLSRRAERNLKQALDFLTKRLKGRDDGSPGLEPKNVA